MAILKVARLLFWQLILKNILPTLSVKGRLAGT